MRKTVAALILILGILFSAAAQSTGPMDLVVLLDTSASMSSYYQDTNNYLIGPFLREFLRIGDTFHLIAFSKTPRLEISRRIEGQGDVETIIARLLLMYPLDPDSDIIAALNYAERYSASIPGSRHRKVILLSDGDNGNTAVQAAIQATSARLNTQGADLQYISIPVSSPPPSSGRAAGPAVVASTPPVQQAPVQQPPQSTQPVTQQPPVTTTPGQQTTTPPPQTTETITTTPPVTTTPGQQTTTTPPPSSGTQTQPPASQGTTQPLQTTPAAQSGGGFDLPLPLIIGLIIIGLLILALIIFFASRRLHSSPNRAMAQAQAVPDHSDRIESERLDKIRSAEMLSGFADSQKNRKPMPKDKPDEADQTFDGGPLMLSLFVEDQNTAIGRRNIHTAKAGYSFTVGGGNSDFLIFLVPIPPQIGQVRFDGRQCTFTPLKPQFFPDIGSQQVSNCIGKTIRVISQKNYELFIRIERYEDPLKALNKLLNSIQVPGL